MGVGVRVAVGLGVGFGVGVCVAVEAEVPWAEATWIGEVTASARIVRHIVQSKAKVPPVNLREGTCNKLFMGIEFFYFPTRAMVKLIYHLFSPSGQRESNPHGQLGRLELYH